MRGNPWIKLTMDTWSLGIEASSVIGLRTLKMAAGGPAAQTEAALMQMADAPGSDIKFCSIDNPDCEACQ